MTGSGERSPGFSSLSFGHACGPFMMSVEFHATSRRDLMFRELVACHGDVSVAAGTILAGDPPVRRRSRFRLFWR
jgi:hypothetical protein